MMTDGEMDWLRDELEDMHREIASIENTLKTATAEETLTLRDQLSTLREKYFGLRETLERQDQMREEEEDA